MRQVIEAYYTYTHPDEVVTAYAYHGWLARDPMCAAAFQYYCPDRQAERAKREYDWQRVNSPFVYEPDGLPNFPE